MGTAADAPEADAAAKASVLMVEKAFVTGSEIYVDDIASIESADEALVSILKKIHICPAPEPGFSQTLHVGYIKSRVRQQGIVPEFISWGGSQRTIVETKVLRLSPQELLSHAEKFITHHASRVTRNGFSSIQIRPVTEIRPAVLPYGEVHVNVESVLGSRSDTAFRVFNGIVPLRFTISVDGRDREKRVIFFKVEVFKEVLVAARAIDRHKTIEASDLHTALRDISGFADVFFQKDDLIGNRSKRAFPKGTIMVRDMVEAPPIIDRGDLVTIVIESPVFRITAQGRAREDGARGQIIRVVNTSSMKEITAQVVDEDLVRVAF